MNLHILDADKTKLPYTITNTNGYVDYVCFSDDASLIFTSLIDGRMDIWDAQNREKKHTLQHQREMVQSAQFSIDNQLLMTTFRKTKEIYIWGVEAGKCINKIDPQDEYIRYCRLSPDGKQIAIITKNNAGIWDIGKNEYTMLFVEEKKGVINCFDFSSDGKQIAILFRNRYLTVRDCSNGRLVKGTDLLTKLGVSYVEGVLFRPKYNNQILINTCESLRLWDVEKEYCVDQYFIDDLISYSGIGNMENCFGWIKISSDGLHLMAHETNEDLLALWELESRSTLSRSVVRKDGWSCWDYAKSNTNENRIIFTFSNDSIV